MKYEHFVSGLLRIALFAAPLALALGASGVASADEPAVAAVGPIEEIIILAPAIVHKEVVGRSYTGAPIEVYTLEKRVSYGDLDLVKHKDVLELRKRIKETAKSACEEIDHEIGTAPLVTTSHEVCIKSATNDAMEIADAIIAAAGGSAKEAKE